MKEGMQLKKLFVGCLAIALLISNMTVVSAQTATDTTQEKHPLLMV